MLYYTGKISIHMQYYVSYAYDMFLSVWDISAIGHIILDISPAYTNYFHTLDIDTGY